MFHQSLQENGITLESCKQVAFLIFVVEGVSGLGAAGSKKVLVIINQFSYSFEIRKKMRIK